MCYPPSARPPDVPRELIAVSGGAGGRDVILTSEDGARFRAYVSPAAEGASGIVIAPDVRGLHPFYEELAERFAAAGVHAIAFDYFGRTAGTDRRPADFDHAPHNKQNTPVQIQADLAAAAAHLRSATAARNIFVTGFCKGGRIAFNASAEQKGLGGVIGFYGWPAAQGDNDRDPTAPINNVDRMRAPVVGLFGGADKGIPQEAVDSFDEALSEKHVPHHIHAYPGAPHSFFDRTFDQYRSECDDAWRRVLGFIRTGDPAAKA